MSFICNFSQLQGQHSGTSRRICIFRHHWAMAASSRQLQNEKETWNVNSPTSHEVFCFHLCYKKPQSIQSFDWRHQSFIVRGRLMGYKNKTIATIIRSIFLRWIYWSLKVSWIEIKNCSKLFTHRGTEFYAHRHRVCFFVLKGIPV